MIYREATTADIKAIQEIRNAVQENRLSDPGQVTDEDCARFLTERGKGWVCETEGRMAGFAIADLRGNNIWALFLHPDFEQLGIGKTLHSLMLDWYFAQTTETLWLGTAPGTRAEGFYRKAGWQDKGLMGKELRFEMTSAAWQLQRAHS